MIAFAAGLALALGPASDRCYRDVIDRGLHEKAYIGDRACIDFAPPRRFEGVWIVRPEDSSFHEGARSLDEVKRVSGETWGVWLSSDERSSFPKGTHPALGHAYRVVFIGRAARDMNRKPDEGYGMYAMYRGVVLVDRMTEVVDLGLVPRRFGTPPPPPRRRPH